MRGDDMRLGQAHIPADQVLRSTINHDELLRAEPAAYGLPVEVSTDARCEAPGAFDPEDASLRWPLL